MQIRVPLWVALAGCLGSVALGTAVAQAPAADPKAAPQKDVPAGKDAQAGEESPIVVQYPYLPLPYNGPYMPTVADWQALRLTALGASTTRVTDEFSRQHLTCFATPNGLVMTLDLLPEPEWKHYVGGGKFSGALPAVKADLEKVVKGTMLFTRNFFPEIKDQDVSLRIFIRSESVGTWEEGRLKLNQEAG